MNRVIKYLGEWTAPLNGSFWFKCQNWEHYFGTVELLAMNMGFSRDWVVH
jgi:hypothetical protein